MVEITPGVIEEDVENSCNGPDQSSNDNSSFGENDSADYEEIVFERSHYGIYISTFMKTFKNKNLESSFQQYSRRLQQTPLIMINVLDIALKILIASILIGTGTQAVEAYEVAWTVAFIGLNVSVCLLGCWRWFANSYLHWAAVATWILLIAQGLGQQGIKIYDAQSTPDYQQYQVWYTLFVVFAPYAMLPLSLVWCIVIGVLSALSHILATAMKIFNADLPLSCGLRILLANFFLFLAVNFAGIYAKIITDWNQRKEYLESRRSISMNKMFSKAYDRQWKLFMTVIPEFFAHEICRRGMNVDKEDKTKRGENFQICSNRYDVSILYADIKGYTELSTKCSAREVANLVTELFDRFDKLASENDCQRIKLLGDCYICVSGLPTSKVHAFCCINMGLQMIEAIQDVRTNMKVNLDMRIGIHSGSVLCGLTGYLKWQYEVWSNDCTIAHHVESGGLPGRVHISAATYERLLSECDIGGLRPFEVEDGKGGSRDDFLRAQNITTYLIRPTEQPQWIKRCSSSNRTSQNIPEMTVRRPSSSKGNELANNLIPDIFRLRSASIPASLFEIEDDLTHKIAIIRNQLVTAKNMRALSLRFRRPSLEERFDDLKDITFKSNLLCCLVLWLFIVAVQIILYYNCHKLMLVLAVMSSLLTLLFVMVMLEELCKEMPRLVAFSYALSKTRARRDIQMSCFIAIMSISGVLSLCLCVSSAPNNDTAIINNTSNTTHNKITTDGASGEITNCHQPEYAAVTYVLCLLSLTCVLQSQFFIKTFIATITAVVYCILVLHFYSANTHIIEILVLLVTFPILVIYHGRLVEVTTRLNFLWKMQTEIALTDTDDTQRTNKRLIQQILPRHVIKHFMSNASSVNEGYSQWGAKVGVMFASIVNFDQFYSEERGVEYMELLNEIIFDFDKLLMEERFKSVEKIKTIRAIYMAASGLDPNDVSGEGDCDHLCALVDYAFAMRDALEKINEHSFKKFRLRVGISCGPLVGGVIGALKPVYDIWGDTVNEASRMESTGAMDMIHVTKHAKQLLEGHGYGLEFRGTVDVKGKGPMETWWVKTRREQSSTAADVTPSPQASTAPERKPSYQQSSQDSASSRQHT